jgi:hypothetical protein
MCFSLKIKSKFENLGIWEFGGGIGNLPGQDGGVKNYLWG